MMRKLRLESERRSEEAALVAAQPEAAPLLTRLEEIYGALRASAPLANGLEQMRGIYHGSTLLALGHALHEASIEAAKPEAERETDYRARNVPFLLKRLTKRLADLHPPHEAALLRRAARSAGGMTKLGLVAEGLAALEVAATALEADPAWRPAAARLSASELEGVLRGEAPPPPDDVGVATAATLYPAYVSDRDSTKALLSERDQLLAKLLECQKAMGTEAFYPDGRRADQSQIESPHHSSPPLTLIHSPPKDPPPHPSSPT